MQRFAVLTAWSVGMVGVGVYWERRHSLRRTSEFPGSPCCSADSVEPLLNELRAVVGADNVLVGGQAAVWTKGARIGQGRACAVVQPSTLREAVDVVRRCAAAGVAVLPQGANTGLTGGSVPRDEAERDFVVVNMRRLNKLTPLDGGRQVLAFAGAGIFDLGQLCARLGRESHSVLGSVFLNPSVAGGVALGSGGTQIRKGPAYTERLLYVRVDDQRRVHVVNTLGLLGLDGDSDDVVLERLQRAADDDDALQTDPDCQLASHDETYRQRVCQLDASVSRYNADVRGSEAVRSEGKVLILASVHATFPQPSRSQTYWIGCRDFATAQQLRRLCLASPDELPSSLEYLNRDSFDVVDRAGRGLCAVIRLCGIGTTLLRLWQMKTAVEAVPLPLFDRLPDTLIYWTNGVFPRALPARLHDCGRRYDHQLLVTVDDFGDGASARLVERLERYAADAPPGAVELHACTADEATAVKFFRFAAAPAFKTYCVGRGLAPLSVDYALPKNYALEPPLPGPVAAAAVKRMRYAHFGCAVVHEDIAFDDHHAVDAYKLAVKHAIEAIGGALPAEHGHGTEYRAPPDMQARWQATDPTNTFNPGVGCTSSKPNWQD